MDYFLARYFKCGAGKVRVLKKLEVITSNIMQSFANIWTIIGHLLLLFSNFHLDPTKYAAQAQTETQNAKCIVRIYQLFYTNLVFRIL